MKDLNKVNTGQLYNLWRNLSVALLGIISTIAISNILPYYLSPIVALLVGTGLYYFVYNFKLQNKSSCIMAPIAILYCIVVYAFVTIILNLLHVWGVMKIPEEFVFFTHPFIPSLILSPVGFIVLLIVYLRRDNLKICVECRMRRTMGGMRGSANVINSESHFQLKNFVFLSGAITFIVWLYYWVFYVDTNINNRDTYIFTWLTILALFVDLLYFSIRYYNLYLDLKENDEIITPREIQDMTAKTFIRYYVICGDYIYLSTHAHDHGSNGAEVIDTPFFTQQTVNGMLGDSAKNIIERMTGINNGELRFFYGRKSIDDNKHSLLRFFYFLDGNIDDYKDLKGGEWISFDKIKYLYANEPNRISELTMFDISRLATIILTEKLFDEEGNRKSKIKSYSPTFTLEEVRKSKIDFQDDKWIKISMFNSDVPMFRLKKWWKRKTGKY